MTPWPRSINWTRCDVFVLFLLVPLGRVSILATPAGCAGRRELEATLADSTISDGSGADQYISGLDCSWLIRAPPKHNVRVEFSAFFLEPPDRKSGECYDYLEVLDGIGSSSPSLGRYCGTRAGRMTQPFISTNSTMLLTFHTDDDTSDQGFSAYYRAEKTGRKEPQIFATSAFDLHVVSDGSIELVSDGKIALKGDVVVSDNQLPLLSTLLHMNETIGKCTQKLEQVQSQVSTNARNFERFNVSQYQVNAELRDSLSNGDAELLARVTNIENRLDATSSGVKNGDLIRHPNCSNDCNGNGICVIRYNSTTMKWQPVCSCYPGYLHPKCQHKNLAVEGDGRHGNRTISSNEMFQAHVALSGSAHKGSTLLVTTDVFGWMQDGVEILVIQMQGANAGWYELNTIHHLSQSVIHLTHPLLYQYTISGSERAQVVMVPNYSWLKITGTGRLYAQAWNGNVGGIVALRANTLVIEEKASIDVSEQGFRGGPNQTYPNDGVTGESYKQAGFLTRSGGLNNAGAGGSDRCYCGEAAGSGSYGTRGSYASGYSCSGYRPTSQGHPGDVYGDSKLMKLFLGSGGGAGCKRPSRKTNCEVSDGSSGGGLIFVAAGAVTLYGALMAKGGQSTAGPSNLCDYQIGGAGSGGTILLSAVTFNIDPVKAALDVDGGSPVWISESKIYSGKGGMGRVRVNYNTLNGFPFDTVNAQSIESSFPYVYWVGL